MLSTVMAVTGRVPGISPGTPCSSEPRKDVDARRKAGHDAGGRHGRACSGPPRLAPSEQSEDVDARLEPGHDGAGRHGRACPGPPHAPSTVMAGPVPAIHAFR